MEAVQVGDGGLYQRGAHEKYQSVFCALFENSLFVGVVVGFRRPHDCDELLTVVLGRNRILDKV